MDFTASVNTNYLVITQGQAANFTETLQSVGGFSQGSQSVRDQPAFGLRSRHELESAYVVTPACERTGKLNAHHLHQQWHGHRGLQHHAASC